MLFTLHVCIVSIVKPHLIDFNILLQPGGVHGADCKELHQVAAEEPVGGVDGIQEPGLSETIVKSMFQVFIENDSSYCYALMKLTNG